MQLTVNDKYELITRNLQEKIDDETIVKKIITQRPLKLYWGTAATGKIHLGYFVPMLKIADLLNAGCEVIILIADLHAALDNMKSTFEQIEMRTKYYTLIIQSILMSLNININKLKFVKGSDFQLSKEYTLDVYKANSFITVNEAKHSGSEVVKYSDNPKINGLLYPTLQALDEHYLGVDAEISGIDQRKIFGHASNLKPKLGYKKCFYYMTSMVPGLRFIKKENINNSISQKISRETLLNLATSDLQDDKLVSELSKLISDYQQEVTESNIQLEKMSSSNQDSKIDLLDSKNQLKLKINKAYCLPGDIEDNSLMTILEKIIFPIIKLKNINFIINRKQEHGGLLSYTNIDDVKNDFKEERLHPSDLKIGMVDNIELIIKPIRDMFQTKELQIILKKAYNS